MPPITLQELIALALPAETRVLAGHSALDRAVTWVIAAPAADVTARAVPGDFAFLLPPYSSGWSSQIAQLPRAGVAGVAVIGTPSPAVIDAAEQAGLPLLALPESVDVLSGRLGETGVQLVLASQLPGRARVLEFDGQTFRVASVSDRLMISTLQRMYRHFYFRLCDIVDSAMLVESGAIDYDDLKSSAQAAGIWEGVATYLVLVSDYVHRFRGTGLRLPALVKDSAQFDGTVMHFGGGFLRVPILPQSIALYRSQFTGLLRRRELQSSARLGLLPALATAAAIGYKITGSDKGIW